MSRVRNIRKRLSRALSSLSRLIDPDWRPRPYRPVDSFRKDTEGDALDWG